MINTTPTAQIIDLEPWLDRLAALETNLQVSVLDDAALRSAAVEAWQLVLGVQGAPRTPLDEGEGESREDSADATDVEAGPTAIAIGDQVMAAVGATRGFLVQLEAGRPAKASFRLGNRTLRLVGDGSEMVRARLSNAEGIIAESPPRQVHASGAGDSRRASPGEAGLLPAPDLPGSRVPLTFTPTHQVAATGATVGSSSDMLPSSDLAGQYVRLIEAADSGWALVECANGSRCWVDAADVSPIARPTALPPRAGTSPAAAQLTYWFYVAEPVTVQATGGTPVGLLSPGRWYPAYQEASNWIATCDEQGRCGWVPANQTHRQ